MYNLFEPGDLLNSPYEALLFDTEKYCFPVRSHWHHYMEIILMVKGTSFVESDEKKYLLHPGDMGILHHFIMNSGIIWNGSIFGLPKSE